jgi:hypothetical protein
LAEEPKEPDVNEAFLREVDDELRRSELEAFWKKWGRLLVVGLVGGLAAFGGWLYWQDSQVKAAGVEAEKLDAMLDDAAGSKVQEAEKTADEIAKTSKDGYRASALLTKAAIAVQKGDMKGAALAYSTIATDADLAEPWRDLALVRQTAVEFDTLKPDVVITRLQKLAVKGHPWFGSAGEMVAIAYMKQGKPQLAAKIFAEMGKDEQVPQTIRARAVQMAASLDMNAAPAKTETQSK